MNRAAYGQGPYPPGAQAPGPSDALKLVETAAIRAYAFRYTRADSRRKAVLVTRSGNTTTTRTRTQGWFHDGIALRFAPDAFPGAARLGPDAYKKLKMPEGFETKHFLGRPGQLDRSSPGPARRRAGRRRAVETSRADRRESEMGRARPASDAARGADDGATHSRGDTPRRRITAPPSPPRAARPRPSPHLPPRDNSARSCAAAQAR